jgi:hypothetical protein
MLKSYPPSAADAAESGGYIGMLAATLVQFPKYVSMRCADPLKGVASASRFKPTVADLTAWCEHGTAELRQIVDRDDQEIRWKRERDEACKAELAAIEDRKKRPTLDELRAKHGPNWGIKRMPNRPETTARQEANSRMQTEREQRKILAEYARLGRAPVYAGDMLVSPSLESQLRVLRAEAEATLARCRAEGVEITPQLAKILRGSP